MKQTCYKFTEAELIHLAIEKIKEKFPDFKYVYGGKFPPFVLQEPDNSTVVKVRWE